MEISNTSRLLDSAWITATLTANFKLEYSFSTISYKVRERLHGFCRLFSCLGKIFANADLISSHNPFINPF